MILPFKSMNPYTLYPMHAPVHFSNNLNKNNLVAQFSYIFYYYLFKIGESQQMC